MLTGIILYFLIGLVLGSVNYVFDISDKLGFPLDEDEKEFSVACATIFWPIFVVGGAVFLACHWLMICLTQLREKVRGK